MKQKGNSIVLGDEYVCGEGEIMKVEGKVKMKMYPILSR